MSTSTAFDLRSEIASNVRRLATMYADDLYFIPEDKLGVCPMGVARTVLDFTGECIGYNLMCAKLIRGEQADRMSDEDRAAFYASINSFAKAKQMMLDSAETLAKSVEGLSDDQLHAPATAPWGQTMPAYQLAQTAASHIMYHDGQINYVQSLYGDSVNHWAG